MLDGPDYDLKPYLDYRESGLPWLANSGDVYEHSVVKPVEGREVTSGR